MNNVSTLIDQNTAHLASQAAPGQRVLHPDGNLVVGGADPVKMTDQRPATGNDHGAAASLDDGPRHLDGAALDTAAHKRRHKLDNHRPVAVPTV